MPGSFSPQAAPHAREALYLPRISPETEFPHEFPRGDFYNSRCSETGPRGWICNC